jgi:hypothetical protein
MALIFPSKVGRPVVISDPHASPISFQFALGGWTGFGGTFAILQGVTATTAGNYQFLYTIGNFTYVYVFGELMGDFAVTGVAMAGACPDGTTHGLVAAISYYNANAISVTGTPVGINFGGLGLLAFLVGASFGLTDPKSGLGQFQLNFKIISS